MDDHRPDGYGQSTNPDTDAADDYDDSTTDRNVLSYHRLIITDLRSQHDSSITDRNGDQLSGFRSNRCTNHDTGRPDNSDQRTRIRGSGCRRGDRSRSMAIHQTGVIQFHFDTFR